jgi:polysaccharide biosynthesis/export protein
MALLVIAAAILPGQALIPGAQAEMGANLPALPIGPNDLLAISVYAAPELTRTVRVSAEGLIRLPMLHEKIEAQGLMPAELETRIAAVLSEEEILVEPVVTVAIAEYHSRPISVAGAVKTPLTFQAAGRTTLLEALTRAQGLTEEAGSEILVTRPSKTGEPALLTRIPVKGLIDAADPQWNIPLEGGEEVRVPQAGRVFVVGNVKRPGAFRVDEGAGMTVLKALAMAEGLMPYATKEAYIASTANKLDELTSILIESESAVKDQAASKDVSPLESQRSWERQAEENLLARLEKGGFLAPAGAVDEVLNTVVNNLIVSANLKIEAHCRVLLTTPIETFSAGHTIIISRGLIDVLPDEASLALVLAGELSHVVLGHRTQTQFAFNNQTMLSDVELWQRFRFQRPPHELAEAGKKTIEIMRASPYQNTANAGLFLKALAGRSSALPRLLEANLGDQMANPEALARLAEFAASAPALEENKMEQIAALPLGSRVKLNPCDNRIELVKTRPIALLSPREKMPFEVTPFALYLTRADPVSAEKK